MKGSKSHNTQTVGKKVCLGEEWLNCDLNEDISAAQKAIALRGKEGECTPFTVVALAAAGLNVAEWW